MTRYVIDDEIVASRNNDGSIVAMKVDDSDLFYKITGVATEVWNKLEAGVNTDEIIASITSEYEISKDVVEKDIEEFYKDLLKFNIIKQK